MPSDINNTPATSGSSSPGFDDGTNCPENDPYAEFLRDQADQADAVEMVAARYAHLFDEPVEFYPDDHGLAVLEAIDPDLATVIRLEKEAYEDDED